MLNSICSDWNQLYIQHPAVFCHDSVTIVEKGNATKNKTNKSITVLCRDVVSFPSKELNQFDLFSACSNKNCDGALLCKSEDNTYGLVFIEMKSRYDTKKVHEAKCQIVESRMKMKPLLKMLSSFNKVAIKSVLGIIVTLELDEDQKNWWSKRQLLNDSDLEFGEKLLKYGRIESPTECKDVLNFPENMYFRIVFSDKEDFSVDYHDLAG